MSETSSLQHEPVMLPGRSFGRTARSVAGYALLLALMFVSPIFVFIPAAIFDCRLRNGRGSAALAILGGAVITFLFAFQLARLPGTSHADALMGYAYVMALIGGIAVPALAVGGSVERLESTGRIVVNAILVSIAGLAATEGVLRLTAGFSPYRQQLALVHVKSDQFMAAYQKASMPADAVTTLKTWMDAFFACLPAFILIDVIIVFVLSLVMFGRIKAWRDIVSRRESGAVSPLPVTAGHLFRNLSLPDWLLFAFVVGGLTPLATGIWQTVAANILAVVGFLYLLQGLAIFRSLLVAVGAGFFGVLFGYLLLAFLTITGIAPLLLSVAGLFDSFFDFRHFRRKDHPDESHPD